MTDGGGHATDLAVFAFAEFEADPGVDDGFAKSDGWVAFGDAGVLLEGAGAAGEATVAFDDDLSATKFFEGGLIGFAFDEDEVATAVLVFGIEEAVFESFFVGEKEEAFAIHVKAAEWEALWGKGKTLQGVLFFFPGVGVELAEHSVGFVEGDEHAKGHRG